MIGSIISALIALYGCFLYVDTKQKRKTAEAAGQPMPQAARRQTIGLAMALLGLWLLVGFVITLLFGPPAQGEFAINIIPPRANFTIYGYQPSQTMLVGWGVMAALIVGAVLLRIFFIPKLSDKPGGFQNIVETLVETVETYTSGQNVRLGRPMFGFIFTIGITLIGNVMAELMGFRSPSSDLMFTIALSFSVFMVANWYGIRTLSAWGRRVRNLISPSPVLMPIRMVTDLVNPFSMACRLFGNTLSGMIVMNLIYMALGNFAVGVPSVVGLYFNVFTALIQTVIFITLSLSTIHDATAEPAA